MPSLRILLLAIASTSLAQNAVDESTATDNWEELVESLPGESLRAALQGNLHQYREGVFEDGRNAIDAVRSDDPALAEALVDLAKQDAVVKDHLRKRQAANTTITSSAEPTTSLITLTEDSSPSTSVQPGTSTSEPEPTQGQSSSSVPDSSPPVDSSPSSTLVVVSTPSATSTEIVVPTTVTSTSLISVPASSTVIPPSTSSAEPTSAEPTVAEPTSTTQGQTSPTTVVAPPSSTGLSPTSSSPEQDSSSVLAEPPITTSTAVVTPTTTDITIVPSPTEPEATSPNTPTTIQAPTTQAPTTQAPSTQAPAPADDAPTTDAPPAPTNVAVDASGSIVTSVPPLWTATESDGDTIVLTSPTPGGVYTTADQGGNVAVVTYTPDGVTVSQVRFSTSILPNGSPSVVTSFATVGAPVPTSDASSDSPDQEDASLQNGAAVPSTWYSAEIALVLCAAIGVAGAVL